MERHTTANTAGNNLTVQAGGATVGATDKNGGTLFLAPGLSTGTGESGIKLQGSPAGSTGTSDNAVTTLMEVLGNKLGFYGVTAIVRPTTSVSAASFVANTSGIVDDTATFGGYTLGQIAQALQSLGLLT